MPRPREFDEDEVVAQATAVFWAQGYEATSVADLMEATGLAKGSIYKGFGDKRTFFLRTLDSYLDANLTRVRELLAAAPCAPVALERWLTLIVDLATCKGQRRGCYAVNCAIELAPHDPELRDRVVHNQQRLRRMLASTITQGIEAGDFAADLCPEAAAHSLLIQANGLQVGGKLGMTRAEALATVELTLGALR